MSLTVKSKPELKSQIETVQEVPQIKCCQISIIILAIFILLVSTVFLLADIGAMIPEPEDTDEDVKINIASFIAAVLARICAIVACLFSITGTLKESPRLLLIAIILGVLSLLLIFIQFIIARINGPEYVHFPTNPNKTAHQIPRQEKSNNKTKASSEKVYHENTGDIIFAAFLFLTMVLIMGIWICLMVGLRHRILIQKKRLANTDSE